MLGNHHHLHHHHHFEAHFFLVGKMYSYSVFVFTVVLLCICMFKSALGRCGTSQGTFIPLSAPVPCVDTMVGIIGHPTIGHPGTFRNHAIIDRRPSLLIWWLARTIASYINVLCLIVSYCIIAHMVIGDHCCQWLWSSRTSGTRQIMPLLVDYAADNGIWKIQILIDIWTTRIYVQVKIYFLCLLFL